MSISRTYITNSISFNRILIKPKIGDILIKSVSVMTMDGEIYQLDILPFVLEEDTVIQNNIKNCTAIIVNVSHPYITTEAHLDDCMVVNVSRSDHNVVGTLNTKPVKIGVKNFISVITKIDNKSGVIISADVGIRCFDNIDSEIINETIRLGLGDSRQIIVEEDNLFYDSDEVIYYKDGLISSNKAKIENGSIINYDDSCIYISSPSYINDHKKIYISENIDIDNNNNIYIKNEHVKFVECSIRCTILDANFASPIIKYIGVISR